MDTDRRILDGIEKPSDLKALNKKDLLKLVDEVRDEIISTVSKTGGHLASSIGAVELIVSLHRVFNSPEDKILYDVGHQAYAHKLLTGRAKRFSSLRQSGGISGFPSREESPYDCFGVGHSSTAISAALGFAVARDMKKENHKVIAVIGDGSITGGIAFEGLNNAGHLKTDLLVILNDNEMFISHRVGAIAGYLARILTFGLVRKIEKNIETFLRRIQYVGMFLLRVAKRFKLLLFPGMLFEEMGFAYLGPIDGHDLFSLIEILQKIKDYSGPVVLHVITKKGKGYKPSEQDPIKFHGATKFEIETGMSLTKCPPGEKPSITYTEVFASTLIELARRDNRIVAVTAAMSEGTGLYLFAKEFPDRFFDVGIAEQHAVTFAGGLSAAGMRPVVAIYSTFLQRAYDQIIHDIALQGLPVVFAIDRAGIVGEDGKTHQGIFDLSYLRSIPDIVVLAPRDEMQLRDALWTAFKLNRPVAVRYPRGKACATLPGSEMKTLETGRAEVLREGRDMCIFAIGNMVDPSLKAAEILERDNISCGVINSIFLKPLDTGLFLSVAGKIKRIVTVEENVVCGGFGSGVCEALSNTGTRILVVGLPDRFIEHGPPDVLREKYRLTAGGIAQRIKDWYAAG
ncbi:MAG: 1-deoxy-D-xylulose-5-phosphate synthase [Elusimicrobiota bacterium]